MQLASLAVLVDGQLINDDRSIQHFSIDTRTLKPGDCYVAIKGANFDGHDFIAQAIEAGASALIVSKNISSDLPTLKVADTVIALGKIAAEHRRQFDIPVIALTGSCGKTSVKEMISIILREKGKVLATKGNFNNQIGVPLSLLQLTAEHDFAVFECGASKRGDIEYVANLIKPTIALITNAAASHLEGFGDLKGVSRCKRAIYQALAPGGTAIVNLEDDFAQDWIDYIGENKNIVKCAWNNKANFYGQDRRIAKDGRTTFRLYVPGGREQIYLKTPGQHSVMNAILAAAAAMSAGADVQDVKYGLQYFEGVAGRMQLHAGIAGSHVINDTYNANPHSVAAALDVLAQREGKRIFVFGDMAELGENAAYFHSEVGELARYNNVDALFTCGKFSRNASEAFCENAFHFETKQDLISALRPQLDDEVTVLVKGSRSSKMEEVVNAITL